ncbi:beta strand repeat-containing protein [Pedobacter sp. BS3]|uniref:beta strand repeat-containing protein n=1 Tax=Pedobacter sp. BS3 TaxID=2567937 RepID=UPI001659CA4E|nr:right-handed parallel beta-helix repeat-containing protein [Pedobacter sp. BS3]
MKKNLRISYCGKVFTAICLLITCFVITVSGQIYVSASGDDITGNGSSGSPYKTINKAISTATGSAVTINIAAGIYDENVVINKTNIKLQGAGNANSLTYNPATNTIIKAVSLADVTHEGIFINNNITGTEITGIIVDGFKAGIVGKLGNSNTSITYCDIINNNASGGIGEQGGIYFNGPLDNIVFDHNYLENNGMAGGFRQMVIWNGFKTHVNITNNTVKNTDACCSIELQDGTASGVNISNNTIENSSDNGIGVTGLTSGAGPNIISGNTITVAKRYGIEIKNPMGSGADDEVADGSIIVKNNIITRSGSLGTEKRDLAGIAVFRRGVLEDNSAGYLDVPAGVVIKSNTIDGFQQPDANGEGYGIVAEGVLVTIKDNIVKNCDVGIQRQSGNASGYVKNNKGDADQAAVDDYFDRGNSPFSAAITLSGNDLSTGNIVQTRDQFAANTYFGDTQYVFNTTLNTAFATIGLGVEAASAGNTLQLSANTFDERVIIDKAITIDGLDTTKAKATYTGPAITTTGNGIPTIFTVASPNVTIKNINFIVNLDKIHSAIHSYGDVSGITITDNNFVAAATGTLVSGKLKYTFRNAVGINIDPYDSDYSNVNTGITGVTIQRNTVQGLIGGTPAKGFRGGFQVDRARNVLIGGNTAADGNTVQTISQDVICRFFTDGDVTVKNNTLNGGGLEMSSTNNASGTVTVEDNSFDGTTSNTYTSLARFQFNTNKKTFIVKNNTFTNVNWGMSLENFNSITLDGNTFTPSVDGFRLVTINTKALVTSPPTTLPMGFLMKNNTFNGLAGSTNGTAIGFYNHNEDGTSNYITNSSYLIGQPGAENTFNTNIKNFIWIDNSNGISTTDGTFQSTYPADYGGIPATTTGYWTKDITAVYNKYDIGAGLQLAGDMNSSDRTTLKTFMHDKDEDNNIGEVLIYFPVKDITSGYGFASIQDAIDDATTQNGDVINVDAGTYTLTSGIQINKELTIQGNNNTTSTKPVINGNDNSAQQALFIVNKPNTTISNFRIEVAQNGSTKNGIRAPLSGTYNNLTIQDNEIVAMSSSYATSSTTTQFGTYGVQLGHQLNASPQVYDKVTIIRNTITADNPKSAFGRAIRSWNINGTIGGSSANANTLKAYFASFQGGIFGGDANETIDFSYNNIIAGKLDLSVFKTPGNTISHNTISSGGTALKATWASNDEDAADQFPALIEINSSTAGDVTLSDNTIQDYKYLGIFVMASSNVNIKNNTLTPLSGVTDFTAIAVNTKTSNSNENSFDSYDNITIQGNTLNGSGSAGGRGIWFANHQGTASVIPFTNIKVGGTGSEENTFASSLATYIDLDNQEVADSKTIFPWNPEFKSPTNASSFYYGSSLSASPTAAYKGDVDASGNIFGGSSSSAMTNADLYALETKISHGIDNGTTGFVTIKPQMAYVSTATETINAFAVVPDANYTVLVKAGTDLSSATISADRDITLDAENATISLSGVTINAAGKTLTLAKPVTVGALTTTAGAIKTDATNILSVSSPTGITTPTANGYVDGPMKVTADGTNAIIFPVGKNGASAPIEVSGTVSSDIFTAEYFKTAYSDVSSVESGLTGGVSGHEYWNLAHSGASNAVTVTLYSFDKTASNIAGSTGYTVAHYESGEWKNYGGTIVDGVPYKVTSTTTLSSFSPFTFGSTDNVLPVNLISFEAVAKTQGAMLTWVTASENNNLHFEIEKSSDGVNFTTIGIVPAQGAGNYTYTDGTLSGLAYYRLVQVDINGKRTVYTDKVRAVTGLNGNNIVLSAYPVPTPSSLNVIAGTPGSEQVTFKVLDLYGRTVISQSGLSNSKHELNLASLASGIYTLQVTTSVGVKVQKIIKQ